MKYGRFFKETQVPEWAVGYLRYHHMKKLIEEIHQQILKNASQLSQDFSVLDRIIDMKEVLLKSGKKLFDKWSDRFGCN